jgi:hypothetical protein
MKIMNVYMPLAKKDEQLLQIEELICAKRKMLIDKQKKLKIISKQNLFLDAVKDDYDKYNSYIIKQKQEQMQALNMLNNYINELTIKGKLTEQNIEDSKHEQLKILKELKDIQKSLDNIIKD